MVRCRRSRVARGQHRAGSALSAPVRWACASILPRSPQRLTPGQYVWQQFHALRRRTGSAVMDPHRPRVISMSSAELGTKESSTPEAVAAFGADAVVFQRVLLRFAATPTAIRSRSR